MPTTTKPTAIDYPALVAKANQAGKCDNEWRTAGSPGELHDWRLAWFKAHPKPKPAAGATALTDNEDDD